MSLGKKNKTTYETKVPNVWTSFFLRVLFLQRSIIIYKKQLIFLSKKKDSQMEEEEERGRVAGGEGRQENLYFRSAPHLCSARHPSRT